VILEAAHRGGVADAGSGGIEHTSPLGPDPRCMGVTPILDVPTLGSSECIVTKRCIGIGGVILLMIAIAIWVALPGHGGPTGSVEGRPVTPIPVHASQVPGSFAAIRADETVSNLWGRPAPEAAARNSRRYGFAWILRQLGATEDQLNRLANLDIAGVLSELKQKASAGDAASINILGEIAYQNCRLGRDDATVKGYVDSQIRNVLAVPAIDSSWFSTVMRDDETFYKKVYVACAHVDVDEAMSWVKAQAEKGDGASLWLMSMDANNMTEIQQRLREAAAAGFPQAQFDLAWAIIGKQDGAEGTGAGRMTAGDMLRASQPQLPRSELQLAVCEYSGCDGVAVDVEAAIKHAREAAQRGSPDAMVYIGPHVPAGQLDPNEVTAWGLVQASLEQRGCGGDVFSIRSLTRIVNTLNAKNISAQARALAEQYWQEYGAQMMANLGCI
jgi:TPR repeat protein